MPIDPETLSSLASDYAREMTSIRGRRVQRLLKREFAGAGHVAVVHVDGAAPAVVDRSASGAAYCATDGRGRQASVVKWLHGATDAVEAGFDLLKDSLPASGSSVVPLADGPRKALQRLSSMAARSEAGRR